MALLLAAQTEKDIPAGYGYLDHAFYGYMAALRAGFLPERRITCPMDGAYSPQQVRRARRNDHLLGQVRDLLVFRKPLQHEVQNTNAIPSMQEFLAWISKVYCELETRFIEREAFVCQYGRRTSRKPSCHVGIYRIPACSRIRWLYYACASAAKIQSSYFSGLRITASKLIDLRTHERI